MKTFQKMTGAFWASVVAAALAIVLLFFAELTTVPVYSAHPFHAAMLRFVMLITVSIFAEWLTTQSFGDLLLDLAIAAGVAILAPFCAPITYGAPLIDNFLALTVPGIIMAIIAAFAGKSKRQKE